MTTFYLDKKKYGAIPESYNELTGKQLIALAKLFLQAGDPGVMLLTALQVLLDKSFFWFALISSDAKARMMQYISWVFEKNTLTNQVLPVYRGFVGPKKEFDNLTLSEFHHSEMYYGEYVADKDEEALNNLVAVLYRPAKPGYNYRLDSQGDARRAFNPNEVEYYADVVASWPAEVKHAILFFYDGCRQKLLEEYAEVFQGDSGEGSETGMFGIIRGIAEGGKFGDVDKVEGLNIHTALLELSMQLKEAEQLKNTTSST